MKAVMISIKPKWCELIASGKKTIEVRKTRPKIDTPFKCYIYCTKIKDNKRYTDEFDIPLKTRMWLGNGKVIGEFVCDTTSSFNINGLEWNEMLDHLLKISCLTENELIKYVEDKKKVAFAWHITDLIIYDKPKELSEFWKAEDCEYYAGICCGYPEECESAKLNACHDGHIRLRKPPQSWCYVEELNI